MFLKLPKLFNFHILRLACGARNQSRAAEDKRKKGKKKVRSKRDCKRTLQKAINQVHTGFIKEKRRKKICKLLTIIHLIALAVKLDQVRESSTRFCIWLCCVVKLMKIFSQNFFSFKRIELSWPPYQCDVCQSFINLISYPQPVQPLRLLSG